MIKIHYILPVFFIFSCSQKDQKMCDCLQAGEKLNEFSTTVLMKDITENDLKKMEQLKKDKTQKCVDFQMMSGEEMLKKKAACQH